MKSPGWVRGCSSALVVAVVLAAAAGDVRGDYLTFNCDKTPDTITDAAKTPGDNGFKVYVTGNPTAYTPGRAYTVNVEGQRYQYGSQKFLGFMLVAEPEGYHSGGMVDVGRFELTGDATTTYSRKCQNAVTHTNIVPKTEVSVRWKAPSTASGCVMFKAMVIERQNVWYMNDGQLELELCPDVSGGDGGDSARGSSGGGGGESLAAGGEILDECLACGEAKYEVVFEGRWSRHTHPKNYPRNEWLTHFSDLIGASHSPHLKVWELGGYASEGLKQVAMYGITRALEGELKKHSRHIRTIIKARGLWHPRVTGKTYAVFRVDRKHHLMTLVSMLGPSPDWFVGVSSLELCHKNGSWARERVIDLYPFDAGVDGGVSYEDNDSPQPEAHKIRRITSSWPDNPRSPFFDHSGTPMKPLATLTVRRQKEYEKSDCQQAGAGSSTTTRGRDNRHRNNKKTGKNKNNKFQHQYAASASGNSIIYGNNNNNNNNMAGPSVLPGADPYVDEPSHFVETPDNSEDALRPECSTTQWSSYSQCSATCGDGLRRRSRMYQNPLKAQRAGCNRQLEETEMCRGLYPDCNSVGLPVYAPYEQDPPLNSIGSSFYDDSNGGGGGDGDEDEDGGGGDPDYRRRCATTSWSSWSPCSVTCGGGGVRTRTRSYHYPRGIKVCKEVVKEEMDCDGPVPVCPNEDSADHISRPECAVTPWSYWSPCSVSCGKGVSVRTRMYVDEQLGARACSVQLLESADCNGTSPHCYFSEQTALETCMLPETKGPCRGSYTRWFYDAATKSCREFSYGGCKGNGNNFPSYDECTKKCQMTLAGAGDYNAVQSAQQQQSQQQGGGGGGGFSSKKRMLMQQAMMNEKHAMLQKQNKMALHKVRHSGSAADSSAVYGSFAADPENDVDNGNGQGGDRRHPMYAGDNVSADDGDNDDGHRGYGGRQSSSPSWMTGAQSQDEDVDDGGGGDGDGDGDGNANGHGAGRGTYVTGLRTHGHPRTGNYNQQPEQAAGGGGGGGGDVRNLYKLLGEMSYKQGGGHLYKSSLLGQGQMQHQTPSSTSSSSQHHQGTSSRGGGSFDYLKADAPDGGGGGGGGAKSSRNDGDCAVSAWGDWSPCSTTCGRGMRERKRTILVFPWGAGSSCPPLSETEQCEMPLCREYLTNYFN